jgi:N-acyl-D-aspartate/D-glutamate deacylase
MGEYLARLEALRPGVNVGFMVGHSALRMAVMGPDGVANEATEAQCAAMADLLRASLAQGGLGFSTSRSTNHLDGEGHPVPSRAASMDEVLTLCRVTGEFPGTQLEAIPGDPTMLIAMSAAAGRPVNWNLFVPFAGTTEQALASSDDAPDHGAHVVALSYPAEMIVRVNFVHSIALAALPGWAGFMTSSRDAKLAALRDPETRHRLGEQAASIDPASRMVEFTRWEGLTISECWTDATRRYEGRLVGDVAHEESKSPWDVVCDIVVTDDLETRFTPPFMARDAKSWEERVRSWSDPRLLLGGSDAGAHLASLAAFDWATTFLALNREHRAMPLEAALGRVATEQADLYGLTGRGRLVPGCHADAVVFDPDRIAPGPLHTLHDLPGGAPRLHSKAIGIGHVVVNGVETVRDGELTGRRAGHVLRPGAESSATEREEV